MKGLKPSKSFLEKVVEFDFEREYTVKVRVFSHIALWLFYTLLYFPLLHFGEGYTIKESILMTARVTVLNMTAFYIFFYVLIPYLLGRNYLVLFVISIFVLIELYLILNRTFYGLVLYLNFPIESIPMGNLMKRVEESNIWNAFSLRRLLVRATDIIFTLSPLFFIKIVFDLSRTYAKSVRVNRKVEVLRTENLKIENKFLNAQLNPHFLFNTLNNLYGLALKKDDLTPELILKLSEIMRYTLYEADVDYIPLTKEIQFIEDYVRLEKLRYKKEISLVEDFSEQDIKDLKIAPLLPFVFLENSFKYGLRSDDPYLRVNMSVRDTWFYFEIKNDYLPLASSNRKTGGIGLDNVKKRLELLYAEKHNLTINIDKNSYIVNLSIDLSTDGN